MHMYLLWYGRLNSFVNLCKAIILFVIFVCPFVRWSVWKNSAHLQTFQLSISIFRKSVENIQF